MVIWYAAARAVHAYAIGSLYTYTSDTEVYLSIGRLEPDSIAELARIVKSDPEVRARLVEYRDADSRLINYVMPSEIFISEIPMFIPEGQSTGHRIPEIKGRTSFKIVFTKAEFGSRVVANGLDILRRAVNKTAIVEVRVDRASVRVDQIIDPPITDFYKGMPVPVF